jgi:hypothetical protein
LDEENERRKQLEAARLNAKGPTAATGTLKADKKREKQCSVKNMTATMGKR